MHGCRVEEEVGARAGQVPDKPAPGDGPGPGGARVGAVGSRKRRRLRVALVYPGVREGD